MNKLMNAHQEHSRVSRVSRPAHNRNGFYWLMIILGLSLPGLIFASDKPAAPTMQSPLRVVVLPLENITEDGLLNDWSYALPSIVRFCLSAALYTEVPAREEIAAAMERADVAPDKPLNAQLAGQIGRELEADVVAWGRLAQQTNSLLARLMVLRLNDQTAAAQVEVSSRDWIGLAQSLTSRLADHLGRSMNDDDRNQWQHYFGTSEKALALTAKALAMEIQKSPVSDREKVLRQALKEDSRSGWAREELLGLLGDAGRENELEDEVREYLRQQPNYCQPHLSLAGLSIHKDDVQAAERELREALQRHRGCLRAARGYFVLHAPANNWEPLKQVLGEIHQVRPDASDTKILLAFVQAQLGETDAARELLRGMDRLPVENELLDMALLGASLACARFDLAARELTRLGQKAADNENVRSMLATMKLTLGSQAGSSKSPITRPRIFTEEELKAELERRLPAAERTSISNPLEITSDIAAAALRVTVGLTNATA